MKCISILVLILVASVFSSSGNEVPGEVNPLCTQFHAMFKCTDTKCEEKCMEWGQDVIHKCVGPYLCLCTKINCSGHQR
ncbi:hypothetical protein HanXRQr2_Chr09g0376391 [Helianthus annuus]|uniref:Knottin, scorpion toxin-like protein n=1 Tax=Helianthus annuus TaxID=4232 RepID=A0A251S0C8_HELAN|nr:hypothetical protein HanXRQr2_Chr09g0376391 [Helianthus annuus]KAJ0892183.1 hypothetical protein HanPSC8_Chr09g0362871 [Helianthus annuus]